MPLHAFLARWTALVLTVSLVCGCASPGATAREEAVMCPKCQVVWVERPDMDDLYVLTYKSEQAMECPDCRSAVETFFRTGRLEHSCTTCGDLLVHCTLHP